MEQTPDRWFALYRQHGDPEALAKVFDATAPRLMRVAIHFAGDVGAAEDLVQATFVTAIERARDFDEARAIEPWLTGILAHHARELRRSARRTPEVDRLIERSQRTPLEEAQTSEISGALAAAIDGLPEPYRQTLILRLRHGLKSADIAHVLGESPSAVRVRIHRGLEKLRQALPAGIAIGGLFALEPTRGLAAVKQSVMTKAVAQVATSSTIVIGGVIVGKKLAVLAGAVALMLAAWWTGSRLNGTAEGPATAAAFGREVEHDSASQDPGSLASSMAAVDSIGDGSRAVIEPIASDKVVPLRGTVLDGETGEPVAGAQVQLFAPRSTKLSALKQRWVGLIQQQMNATIRTEDTFPWFPEELSDLARADAETFIVYDSPLPGMAPIAAVISGADGAFELPATQAWGFLTCDAAGYGKREMSARRNETLRRVDAKGQSRPWPVVHDSVVVRLWRPKTLSGCLIDPYGERVRQRLKFCFLGRRVGAGSQENAAFDPAVSGSWIVETDEDGNFSAELASPRVSARCIDPGWTLVRNGIHPTRKENWEFESSFEPGNQSDPAWLVVRRMTMLSVTDAANKKPIESFLMLARERGDGYPQLTGKFYAPGGKLCLVPSSEALINKYMSEQWRRPLHLTLWAPGHSAVELDVSDPLEGPDIAVELHAGDLPVVRGTVRAASEAVEGSTVSVVAFSSMTWYPEDEHVVDAMRTGRDGAFEFRLPAGRYLLRCKLGPVVRCNTFQVPTPGPLAVDLDRGGSITVRVSEANGTPRPGHRVSVHGSDGRSEGGETDGKGEVTVPLLAPGQYTAFIPFKTTGASFSADAQETFDLGEDEHRRVDFRLPSPDPRHARLVLDDGESYEGWRAHVAFGSSEKWIPVQAGGTIPIDIQFGVQIIEIEGRARTRWSFSIPKDPPDGFPLRVSRSGRGFNGVLRDASTERPLGGVCVIAVHWSKDFDVTSCVACMTDSEGRFELRGLQEAEYELSFRYESWDRLHWDRSMGEVSFLPFQLPADPPIEIDVRVPRLNRDSALESETVTLSGKVRVAGASGGRPHVRVTSFIDSPGGTLRLLPSTCYSDVDADGSYRVVVPRAARYRATFYDWEKRQEFPAREWTSTSDDAVQTRDFDL